MIIEVRGLRALGVHGALQEERERPQPFEIDFEATLEQSASASAALSDSLADTVDYGVLAIRAAEVVSTESFHLLEALADAVAAKLLEVDSRVTQVVVTIRKLRPPLALDIGSVGVRTVRL